jgi:ABC-2 type transport system permease protein
MRSVIEEKTNRIVEVIISTVKPLQLMMGKIIGVAFVGLTQFSVWILLLALVQIGLGWMYSDQIAQIQQMQMMNQQAMQEVAPDQMAQILAGFQAINIPLVLFGFFFYFLGGFLLYAALFAAVGSTASDEGDIQSLSFPITIPVLISFFIMLIAIQNPHGSLAFWSSMIPLSSPLVMPARIPFGVPTWELLTSMLLLVLGFVGSTWLAARIYRTGILMYGKKISIREVGKWFFKGG